MEKQESARPSATQRWRRSAQKAPDARDPQVLEIALDRMADAREIIGAVKAQRWDLVKWVITANFALTTAQIAIRRSEATFVLLAALMAAFGVALLWHYNRRATEALRALNDLGTYVKAHYPELPASTYHPGKRVNYDFEELVLFNVSMIASVFPPILVALM